MPLMDTSPITSKSLTRSLLQDHNSRIEQHKINFDTLQKEYLKLQEMYDTLKDEQSHSAQNFTQMVTKSEDIIHQLQVERDEKIMECDHLQQQVMGPYKVTKLHQSVSNEMEDTYRKHIEELEMELEVRNNEIGQLRRAYDYLKLEFSALQTTSESRVKEASQQHHSQVDMLTQKVKELTSRLERDIPAEVQRVRQLQTQNSQLNECSKHLLNENKDLKGRLKERDTHQLHDTLSLRQQAVKTDGVIEQLSSDKLSLTAQLKRLEIEQDESRKEMRLVSEELHRLQRDLLLSQRKCDELIHEHDKVKDHLLLNNLQEVQLVQGERNKCIKMMEQYKNQTITLQHNVKQLESALLTKTQELMSTKDDLTRQDWERTLLAEKERGEIEQQLTNSQSLLISNTEQYEQQLSLVQDQLATTEADKISLESECELMKRVLDEKKAILLKAAKELSEMRELRTLIQSITAEKRNLEEANESLNEQVSLLTSQLPVLQRQVTLSQSELRSAAETHQKELQRSMAEYTDGQMRWQDREKELIIKYDEAEQQNKLLKKKKDKLKRQNESCLTELHRLMETSTHNEQEAITERERLRKSYEEDKRMLKKQLQSLQKHHQHFQHLLNSTPEVVYPDSEGTISQ